MTKITLLEQLKAFTEAQTGGLLLPVPPTEEDEHPKNRAASVYAPCLPELRSYEKKAPFVTHEVLTSKDIAKTDQRGLRRMQASAVVRSCFCVFHADEQAGGLALLNLVERLRIGLLETIWVGQFKLDVEAGLDTLIYPKDPYQTPKSPFHLGEMISTWIMPTIERKLPHGKENIDHRGGGYPGAPGGGL